MATERIGLEKILEMLRKKVTKDDLKWLENTNPVGYKSYKEFIETKENLADVDNMQALIFNIQYLIDAITRENTNDYQYADIPKSYMPKLAKILDMDIKKKFNKKNEIAKILENIINKTTARKAIL